MNDVIVRETGPVFDGRAIVIVDAGIIRVKETLAKEGVAIIRHRLSEVYQYNPRPPNAGFYQSQIRAEMSVEDVVITDGDVVYGPWLEGVGSRNSPVTRFPGYHTFRKVTQQLNTIAGPEANIIFRPFVEELNA